MDQLTEVTQQVLRLESLALMGPSAERLEKGLDELASLALPDGLKGRLFVLRSKLCLQQGALDEAISHILAAGPLLKEEPERDLEAQLLAARLLNRTGRREQAQALQEDVASKIPSACQAVRLQAAMAEGERWLDEGKPEAEGRFEQAVELARAPAQAADRYQAQLSLCLLTQARQALTEAQHWARAARATAAGANARAQIAEASLTLGNLGVARDDLACAREAYLEVISGEAQPPARALALGMLARMDVMAGDGASAVARGMESAELSAGLGLAGGYADGLLMAAQGLALQGQRVEAEALLNTGAAVLRGRGESSLAELVLLGLTELRLH